MIVNGKRLYINLTNKCNTNCPFCCMYSDTTKNSFISFDAFKKIIDSNCNNEFELQLEGGEPLLHKDIFLHIEYAIHTGKCKKIIILTNGLLLPEFMKRFVDISNWYKIPLILKVSINYHLLMEDNNHLKKMANLVFATQYVENIDILFNVRKRIEDTDIEDKLVEYGLYERSNIFFLQSYGRMLNSTYDKPIIVQNIEYWDIYASDGTCFGQDLIARSEYENTL